MCDYVNNSIPSKKIIRWIDKRIADATVIGDLNLLSEFKELIIAYDKDEDLKRALSNMGMKNMANAVKREQAKSKKKK